MRPIVDRLAAEFGINVIREKDGTITHNLRTAVIDPAGRVVSIVDNNAWTADELAAPSRMPSPPRVRPRLTRFDTSFRRRIMPPRLPFTKAERALIARLNTPSKVQRWLNALAYNTEKGGETQRSFRPVMRSRRRRIAWKRRSLPPSSSNSMAIRRWS